MKRTVKDLVGIRGKVVLLRVDFNVPMDENGKILDATRIVNALPTIKYLSDKGAKIVILSHLGRPKGFEIHKSLWPVAMVLMRLLKKRNVSFCNKVIGDEVKERISLLREGNVLLLENTRFYKGEEECDMDFAREIASMGDIFVNDAFGTAHRKNATTYGLARILPNAIGLLVEKEIEDLSTAMQQPARPFVAVLGGAKVNTKIKIMERFLEKADTLIIGGAMAYTFLKAQGINTGASIVDDQCLDIAKNILERANEQGKKILLPIDHICVSKSDSKKAVVLSKKLKGDLVGYDIGSETIELYKKELMSAKQIFWNGPMGLFEKPEFSTGTLKIAEAIANNKGKTIVGGGDTVSALNQLKLNKKVGFVSTGGGATMEFLEEGTLPCIDIIQEKII